MASPSLTAVDQKNIADILDFWFLPPTDPGHLQFRMVWFRSTPEFDAEIHSRFGALIDEAQAGGLKSWESTADGLVAKILVLDQFTRNTRRGTPGAFAGDPEALRCSLHGIDTGIFAGLPAQKMTFALMPLMHSEDLAIQNRGAEVEWPKLPGFAENASLQKEMNAHRDMIVKFGRFPHRNDVLGRGSTPEEQAFLDAAAHRYGQDVKPAATVAAVTHVATPVTSV